MRIPTHGGAGLAATVCRASDEGDRASGDWEASVEAQGDEDRPGGTGQWGMWALAQSA